MGSFQRSQLCAFILVSDAVDALEVMQLGTAVEFQRKGHMQKLLNSWVSKVQRQIWLEVSDRNTPAINFYKKLGFSIQGKRPKYYPDGSSALTMSSRASQRTT